VYPEQMLFTNSQQVIACDLGGSYTVPAGMFGSNTSQAEADAQAVAYGTNICAGNYWNTEQTASCPSGSCGSPVVVPARTFYSSVSQSAANSLALSSATAALSCSTGVMCDICGGKSGWPTVSSGFPYSNTGNNVTSFNSLGEATTSDGSVISVLNTTYTQIPCAVSGDFTASMEVYSLNDYARGIGFALTSSDGTQSVAFAIFDDSDADNRIRSYVGCSTSWQGTQTSIHTVLVDQLHPLTWIKLTVKRASGAYSFLINDLDMGADFSVIDPNLVGKLAIVSVNDAFNIRNISIS